MNLARFNRRATVIKSAFWSFNILFLAQDVTQIIVPISLDQAFSLTRKKWVVEVDGWVFLKPALVSLLIEKCAQFEKKEIRAFFRDLAR